MRDYGKVHASFWSSATIQALSEDGRMLALYLMTSPHSTIAGVFRLPDGYACEDLKWTSERVAKGFAELLSNGFANRCETTKWVWIAKHLEWNPPENPNQRKSAVKVAQSVPTECSWRPDFMRSCMRLITNKEAPEPNPSETLAQPLPNQEQKQEQKQKNRTSAKTRKTTIPPDFAISDRVRAWAEGKGYGPSDLETQFESFVSYVKRKGATYADWDEALMTAVRDDWGKVRGGRPANDDPYGLRTAL